MKLHNKIKKSNFLTCSAAAMASALEREFGREERDARREEEELSRPCLPSSLPLLPPFSSPLPARRGN